MGKDWKMVGYALDMEMGMTWTTLDGAEARKEKQKHRQAARRMGQEGGGKLNMVSGGGLVAQISKEIFPRQSWR